MKTMAIVRTAATVLVAACGGMAFAQSPANPAPTPPVMTDVAPLPPQERGSHGAIQMADQPVLAKRAYLERLAAEQGSTVDTRSMGAGPARIMRREQTRTDLKDLRAKDAADLQQDGNRSATPK
jgi:hypothetical protein